jgi:glycosyltransferase involved in cell wall biosynthesis
LKPTKILYGIEASGGGAFKHVTYLATKLPKQQFSVTVLYSTLRRENIDKELEVLEENGIELIPLTVKQNISPIADIKTIFKIVKLISNRKFDIIHAHSSKAGMLFRLAGVFFTNTSVYYTPHCFHFQSRIGVVRYLSICYEAIMAIVTKKIIVSTGEYQKALACKIIPKRKFEVINNAVSFEDYKLEKEVGAIRKTFKIPKSAKFLVGGIGRLEPQKDWYTFIQAAAIIVEKKPNILFLIVGEGSLEQELKQIVETYNLSNNILFTGYVKDIYKVYNIIDVLLSTSLWEGLPYVVLEAAMYNTPVVATNILSNQLVDPNPNCECKDCKCLAQKILKLIDIKQNNIDYRDKQTYSKFSFREFLLKHVMLYNVK